MSKQNSRILSVALLLALVTALLTGCSGGSTVPEKNSAPTVASASPGSPANGLIQTNSGGGVTIDVEWRGLSGNSLAFGVTMDTHSGSLDEYDLYKLAILRDSNGKEYRASNWNAPAGGHHRKGVLTFPVNVSTLQNTKYVTLIIRNTAGVSERSFKWQLG